MTSAAWIIVILAVLQLAQVEPKLSIGKKGKLLKSIVGKRNPLTNVRTVLSAGKKASKVFKAVGKGRKIAGKVTEFVGPAALGLLGLGGLGSIAGLDDQSSDDNMQLGNVIPRGSRVNFADLVDIAAGKIRERAVKEGEPRYVPWYKEVTVLLKTEPILKSKVEQVMSIRRAGLNHLGFLRRLPIMSKMVEKLKASLSHIAVLMAGPLEDIIKGPYSMTRQMEENDTVVPADIMLDDTGLDIMYQLYQREDEVIPDEDNTEYEDYSKEESSREVEEVEEDIEEMDLPPPLIREQITGTDCDEADNVELCTYMQLSQKDKEYNLIDLQDFEPNSETTGGDQCEEGGCLARGDLYEKTKAYMQEQEVGKFPDDTENGLYSHKGRKRFMDPLGHYPQTKVGEEALDFQNLYINLESLHQARKARVELQELKKGNDTFHVFNIAIGVIVIITLICKIIAVIYSYCIDSAIPARQEMIEKKEVDKSARLLDNMQKVADERTKNRVPKGIHFV